jgi:oxalate decarboxylase/phosphoglucose isomerase-like protein (cupin superfamily)
MRKWAGVVLDDETMWPPRGKVPLDASHADDRGYIQSIVNFPMKNLSLIRSTKGAVRSNHYHVTDWHYMYVTKGSFDYYWRATGSDAKPEVTRVSEGELIFTPPMEDHATVFIEETDMIVVSRNPRDQATYESDVRRVILIDPASVDIK